MKKNTIKYTALLLITSMVLSGCGKSDETEGKKDIKGNVSSTGDKVLQTTEPSNIVNEKEELVDLQGTTLATRIKEPKGYTRVEAQEGSFTDFIRNYEMEPDGSEVLLYDGEKKTNQSAHVAIFKLPLENYDLQQCADSIMRMYAEYYYSTKQYDKIGFHFVSGFYATFSKWRSGYNINVSGNSANWVRDLKCNSSYESFKKYLKIVFSYAGTLSMENESQSIDVQNIEVGDIFLKGASPGHVVMVVDKCVNEEGKIAFLLAQGYMPAQMFHVLKNDNSADGVWYYADDIKYPFETPEYSFEEGSLRRLQY